MSLITRCPACGTMFKVVPDHLRISDGWVRCGQCSEVFDAREHLQQLAPAPETITVRQPDNNAAGVTPVPDASHAEDENEAGIIGTSPLVETAEPALLFPASVDVGFSEDPDAGASRWPVSKAPESTSEFESQGAENRVAQEPNDGAEESAEAVVPMAVVPSSAMTENVGARRWTAPDSVLDEDVSFVREARRRAFWHTPLVRGGLLLLAFVLACLLLMQVLVHERDNLAALNPRLKPWLVRLCAPLNCEVAVPRRIEAVLIDSSTFSKVAPDTYRLAFTIRNSASFDVATPSVEITLTDHQDQAVLRRVFSPSDLGAKPAIAPTAEWSVPLHMNVDAGAVGGRIAGYRLLAFYP